ncbi:substrate-binding domain-containing protein [Neiella sp. HB171785]|uniref:Substrate-binding domain-containing protein n=1 Tax=Neiella litorisoli TaxID=2771431 RepID=A0A8J6R261_9GAMM|nr:substrate-binding domain-containing protein [Neiella litorisoli]MBD1388630.1 substrate-binding domain-containing protein [Neiella litorisoli]
MRMTHWIAIGLAIWALALPAWAKPINVLYMPPGTSGYWHDTTIPMPAVAEQLGINLTIMPIKTKDFDYEQSIIEQVTGPNKPDWLIWSQRRLATEQILDVLEQQQIKSIDITSGLFEQVKARIGYPQQRYQQWMAEVVSDEYSGGRSLVNDLIQLKTDQFKADQQQVLRLVGLAGSKRVAATLLKTSAMRSTAEQEKLVELLQVVFINNWGRVDSQRKVQQLFSRYQSIDLFWAANTAIALGAVDQIHAMNFEPDDKPLIASFGWNQDVFQAITNEDIAFSLGGNQFIGAWSLVVLYDMANGYELADIAENNIVQIPFFKATKQNIDDIMPFFQQAAWKQVDIKQFSRKHNPDIQQYNFDFSQLINQSQSSTN